VNCLSYRSLITCALPWKGVACSSLVGVMALSPVHAAAWFSVSRAQLWMRFTRDCSCTDSLSLIGHLVLGKRHRLDELLEPL
jgi:hypothetical protein